MFFLSRQAAELAEFTAKIALLEEAKRKKEDEASEWQHKVSDPLFCPCVFMGVFCMLRIMMQLFFGGGGGSSNFLILNILFISLQPESSPPLEGAANSNLNRF